MSREAYLATLDGQFRAVLRNLTYEQVDVIYHWVQAYGAEEARIVERHERGQSMLHATLRRHDTLMTALRETALRETAARAGVAVPSMRALQDELPWGLHTYAIEFLADVSPIRDAQHALLHVHKAGGKLASALANGGSPNKYLADLLICTARMGNVWPGGAIDLDAHVGGVCALPVAPTAVAWLGAVHIIGGTLAEMVDEHCHGAFAVWTNEDAGRVSTGRARAANPLATLVVATAHLAAYWPTGPVDLPAALAARVAGKLAEKETGPTRPEKDAG